MTVTFAVDVDNTLLDNDALLAALAGDLRAELPPAAAARFWDLYEASRREAGIASPTEAARRITAELGPEVGTRVAAILERAGPDRWLYPRSLAVLAHLRRLGKVVIFSDGDASYQPWKIERSGIARAADAVIVVARKQDHLAALLRAHPADAYVFVDDKAAVLADIGRRLPAAFLVHVRQGKYGTAATGIRFDREVSTIAELERLGAEDLPGRAPR